MIYEYMLKNIFFIVSFLINTFKIIIYKDPHYRLYLIKIFFIYLFLKNDDNRRNHKL